MPSPERTPQITAQGTNPKSWDAALYDSKHSFVWRYGAELIELLAPQRGERILDLGCGTGHLTHRIAQSGAKVIGLDRSPAMLAEARRNYPELRLVAADATRFEFAAPFDAVFSNATLHWILDAEHVVECVATSLSDCPAFDRLVGSRIAVANLEFRFPLLRPFGLRRSVYGAVPVETALFADWGVAWDKVVGPFENFRKGVSSVGAAVRVNAFGFAVVQFSAARPFDRPGQGWKYQFSFSPGW